MRTVMSCNCDVKERQVKISRYRNMRWGWCVMRLTCHDVTCYCSSLRCVHWNVHSCIPIPNANLHCLSFYHLIQCFHCTTSRQQQGINNKASSNSTDEWGRDYQRPHPGWTQWFPPPVSQKPPVAYKKPSGKQVTREVTKESSKNAFKDKAQC